ncbi:glycerophosphodiester phosphodiesterase [Spirosoma utsteinense]|uniref:Glycerophosphoryl diester phosphodiesterase n=1 Tax=Spirosoma utsteinense TaxID=2585773 RepID=A0ABR6W0N5_9BACT|nr:glycerophosphodiester phosphodiesterase family protein [Spirosoma utsteinense]MBC3783773.1 glycerophosphoryl diester phosphodiesterase [Spirosoma utsteinense]MBC3790083.1 glycerophosphoryl diester phosphodiesterase [Spirosoma utsteinense]
MRVIPYVLISFLFLVFLGCRKQYEAPVPYEFANAPGAGRFTAPVRQSIEGVYGVTDGAAQFGEQVALKWSYVLDGADTTHFLSIFTGVDVCFFNLEVEPQADILALTGYWRKLVNTETGRTRLAVRVKRNGQLQRYSGGLTAGDTLVLDGVYGNRTAEPTQKLTFTYRRPLNQKPFSILAHRSGGRTSDLLSVSENSIEIIRLASRLGATGIEIDVRYTKDGVPILYHDNSLNLRLIQKNGLDGAIEKYTYQQLQTFVRLINGERIPTLEEALETILTNTTLNFVWLDTKYIGPMDKVQALQQKFRQRAILARRDLRIVIGLPTQGAVDAYNALPDKENTPILCELDTAITRSLNARIWAPRWTLGPQTEEVLAMKSENRTVFVWTLDEPKFIEQFITEGRFDGILSNYSPVVAYYHYIGQ